MANKAQRGVARKLELDELNDSETFAAGGSSTLRRCATTP